MMGNRRIILAIFVLLPIFRISAQVANLDSGLVGFWSFNDGTATDFSGNGNNGIFFGTNSVSGISDFALYFDNNDYIDLGNPNDLNPSDQMSITAWYKPISFEGNGNNPIIDKGYYTHVEPYYQYHLGVCGDQYPLVSNAAFYFDITLDGIYYGTSTGAGYWSPGDWYFIVGCYDGQVLRLYVNGDLIDYREAIGQIVDYDQNCLIGKYSNLNDYLPGTIDEVRFYNRALMQNEIMYLYNNPNGTSPQVEVQDSKQFEFPSQAVYTVLTLTEINNNPCFISLQISDDGGLTWNVTAVNSWGDIGPNISPGTSKTIYWNAGLDYPNQFNQNMRIKIIADDRE